MKGVLIFKEDKIMKNTCFDIADEVYFFMEEPELKQIDCEELEKEHGDEYPPHEDDYCENETSRD